MPIANPGQQMQRHTPIFDADQIAALVGYVASLGNGPAIPSVQTTGADVAAGAQLYAANCAACHGAGGAGGTVGTAIAPPLNQADALTVAEAVLTGPIPMPRFIFSQQQLNDLAAYVVSLRSLPHPGGFQFAELGPVAEGFLAGFVGIITLLAVARWTASGPIDVEDSREGDAASPTDAES
jgi:ubiquinol-cytochrome c reductase cytochrome c subunit